MNQGVMFIFREAIGGIRRSPLHSFIALSAAGLAVFIIGLFAYSSFNLQKAAGKLLDEVEVQAFISLSLPDSSHAVLHREILQLEPQASVTYVSRDQAAKEFARDFDPELFDVLRENPLPASFRIHLPVSAMRPDSMEVIVHKLQSLEGIEEVIYDRLLLDLLHSSRSKLHYWGIALVGVSLLLAIGLIFNTLRLKIHHQRDAVELMVLLGATPRALQAIFWMQGAVLGLLGGVCGFAAVCVLAALLRWQMTAGWTIALPYAYLLIIAGGLLGAASGMLAARTYLRFQTPA
jgi:cell division transport system permease protein